jgi:peptidoglycan hydrolase-like protein with peptidoglycan-binding domain
MASLTMSGYPSIADYGDPALVSHPVVPGTGGQVQALGGLRAGAVAGCLLYVAARWHKEVEQLSQQLGCWGYQYRTIRQGEALSNHAAGAAIDLNAVRHPQGAHGTLNAHQVAQVSGIETVVAQALNWGGRFTGGSTDEMHWQVSNGRAGSPVEQLWSRIRSGQVPNVPAELRAGSGAPAPAPTPPPAPTQHAPAYPFRRGDGRYFGPFEGPAESISGLGRGDGPFRPALAQWQIRATASGYHAGSPDGLYGPKTAAAARLIQAAAHIAVDGLIGWDTWAAAWAVAPRRA